MAVVFSPYVCVDERGLGLEGGRGLGAGVENFVRLEDCGSGTNSPDVAEVVFQDWRGGWVDAL